MVSLRSPDFWAGPALIGAAALLWATDALVRLPATGEWDPTFLVFTEHVLAVILLLPYVIYKYGKSAFDLEWQDWLSALFVGVGGSALGLTFFTASFIYVNPSVAILLQKLQPVIAVTIAFFLLGERPNRRFYFLSVVALAAGVILSFPDLNFSFLGSFDVHSRGIYYALGAAFLWAGSTVMGKVLLQKAPPGLALFWRFFFGLIALSVIMAFQEKAPNLDEMWTLRGVGILLYLGLVPGLLGIYLYYRGLARTSASVATFMELLYPIGAVILNTAFLNTRLEPVQVVSGLALIVSVTLIGHPKTE